MKRFNLLFIFLCALTLLTGCGGGSTDSSANKFQLKSVLKDANITDENGNKAKQISDYVYVFETEPQGFILINGGTFSSGLKNDIQFKFSTDTKFLSPAMSFVYRYPNTKQKLEKVLNVESLDTDYIKGNDINQAKLNQIIHVLMSNNLENNLANNISDENDNLDKIIQQTKNDISKDGKKKDIAKLIELIQNLPKDTNLNKLEKMLKKNKENIIDPKLTFETIDVLNVLENQTKVATLKAIDPENNTIVYSIDGSDKDFFTLDKISGKLSFKTAPDYEARTSYSITISASNGFITITKPITINIINTNDSILNFNPTQTFIINENEKDITTFKATDSENSSLFYSINGNDKNFFNLNQSSGKLSFKTPPDYETKTDYNITISASNGFVTITKPIYIKIKNVYEFSDNINNHKSDFQDVEPSFSQGLNLVLKETLTAVSITNSLEDQELLIELYQEYFGDISDKFLQNEEQNLYLKNITAETFFTRILRKPENINKLEETFKKYFGEYKKYDDEDINRQMTSASVLTFGNLLSLFAKYGPDTNLQDEILVLFDKYLGVLKPQALEGNTEAKYYRNLAVAGLFKIALSDIDNIDRYQNIFESRLGVISPEEFKTDEISMYYRNKSFESIFSYDRSSFTQANFTQANLNEIKTKILDKYFQKATYFQNDPTYNSKKAVLGKLESFKYLIEIMSERPNQRVELSNIFKEYLGDITPELVIRDKEAIKLRNLAIGKLLEASAREPEITDFQSLTDRYLGTDEYYKDNEYYKNSLGSRIVAFETLIENSARQPEAKEQLKNIFVKYLGDITPELISKDKEAIKQRNLVMGKLLESHARQPELISYLQSLTDRYLGTDEDYKDNEYYKNSLGSKIVAFGKLLEAFARQPELKEQLKNIFIKYLGDITPELISKDKEAIKQRNLVMGKLLEASARQPELIPELKSLTDKYLGTDEYYKNNEYYKNSLGSKIVAFGKLMENSGRQPELKEQLEEIFKKYLGDIKQELANHK